MRAFGDYVIDGTASTMKQRDYKDATDLVFQVSKRCDFDEAPISFSSKDYGGDAMVDIAPTLRAGGHLDSHANAGNPPAITCDRQVLPFDTTQVTSPSNYSSAKYGDPCHPLAAGAHPPAVCVTGSVTHTLTGEGHDASEDGTGRGNPIVAFTQNSRDEVRLINEDGAIAGALSAESGSHQTNYLATHTAVRRLMPIECEALQGFPLSKASLRLNLWSVDKLPVNANAANQCIIEQSNASHVEEEKHHENVKFAKASSKSCLQVGSPPVHLHVQLNCETKNLKLHSVEKSFCIADNVETSDSFHQPIQIVDFVRLLAVLMVNAETSHQNGKVESHPTMTSFIHLQNGNRCVDLFGPEIVQLAEDATLNTIEGKDLFTSTISNLGKNIDCSHLNLQTLSSCALAVIASYIPSITWPQSSFSITFEIENGYTRIPISHHTTKKVSKSRADNRWEPDPNGGWWLMSADGPRYKQLGNSMATNVMHWLGGRIKDYLKIEKYLETIG